MSLCLPYIADQNNKIHVYFGYLYGSIFQENDRKMIPPVVVYYNSSVRMLTISYLGLLDSRKHWIETDA